MFNDLIKNGPITQHGETAQSLLTYIKTIKARDAIAILKLNHSR